MTQWLVVVDHFQQRLRPTCAVFVGRGGIALELLAAGKGVERQVGLVTNLSGMFGKQGCSLFSNLPNADGYRYEDVTSAVAAKDLPLPLNGDYAGEATIVGYTVVYLGEKPSHGVAVCDTRDGERTVARTDDKALLALMTQEEFCGRVVQVQSDGRFSATE